MKMNSKLFEDVFMDIDWSLYDDETAELSGLEKKIYSDAMGHTHHPKTKVELIEAIKEELKNGNTDLNCIDTSEITDMFRLFQQPNWYGIHLSEEQQKVLDVSDWDVSNVEYMDFMFSGCTDFNQDLSGWDVSNAENMEGMFSDCTNFNQNTSGWDVRNVRNMRYMFYRCSNFDQDLSGWDVRNVEYMNGMFYDCAKLKENGLIPDWYNPYKYK